MMGWVPAAWGPGSAGACADGSCGPLGCTCTGGLHAAGRQRLRRHWSAGAPWSALQGTEGLRVNEKKKNVDSLAYYSNRTFSVVQTLSALDTKGSPI